MHVPPSRTTAEYALEDAMTFYDQAAPAIKLRMGRLTVEDYVGFGGEKVVFDYQQGLVGAFIKSERTPQEIKQEFYKRKLVKVLAPEFIPDVRWASTKPPMLVLEKVEGESGVFHKQLVRETKDKFRSIGVYFDFYNELDRSNFIVNDRGVAVYIDNLYLFPEDETLRASIEVLPDKQRLTAEKYVSRLQFLGRVDIN